MQIKVKPIREDECDLPVFTGAVPLVWKKKTIKVKIKSITKLKLKVFLD